MHLVRKVAGCATRCQVARRSLSLDLALTEGKSGGDPFGPTNAMPIISWARVVFGAVLPIAWLQMTLLSVYKEIAGIANPWSHVHGPCGVFIISLARLGWRAQSARVLVNERGRYIDLMTTAVGKMAVKRANYLLMNRAVELGSQI
jgi:hypothetical protein